MARLVLVDTAAALPGLLPLHAWSALMSSELVLLRAADHPFAPHLAMADLRHEVVPDPDAGAGGLSRANLLSGLDPRDLGRATWIVDRARAVGEVAYLYGPDDGEPFTRTLGLEAARAGIEVEVVYFTEQPTGLALLDLVRIEQRLRGPGGCPWDHQQTHASLGRHAIEEVYELLEAIDAGAPDAIREELGDLLLQVVFHAQIAADDGTFDIDAVAREVTAKLIRRHPHVFADAVVADADGVIATWEELKAAEKPERTEIFDGVTAAQPALQLAHALQARVARAGFDWDGPRDAAIKVRAELDEFLAATDDESRDRELGDLLLAVVSLARVSRSDPEAALRAAAGRFRRRVQAVATAAGAPLATLSAADWHALWDQAKERE